MKKYRVHVTAIKFEMWDIEAETEEEARDNYGEGRLCGCSEEDCEITSVEEVTNE